MSFLFSMRHLAFAGAMLLGLSATKSDAATLTVTNTNDSGPGSLRQAIKDAASQDTIVFDFSAVPTPTPTVTPFPTATPLPTATPRPTATARPTATPTPRPTATPRPGGTPVPRPTRIPTPRPTSNTQGTQRKLAQTTNPQSSTITLTAGYLKIDKPLTIQGPTDRTVIISANKRGRVFQIENIVTLSNLTIANGQAGKLPGGGIYNTGALTLNSCTITDNHAYKGGGIYNTGTVRNSPDKPSYIIRNVAQFGGGIFNDSMNRRYSGNKVSLDIALDNCTLSSNVATGTEGGEGGAVYNAGDAVFNRCFIANNSADYFAAFYNDYYYKEELDPTKNPEVKRGMLEVYNSTIYGNTSKSAVVGNTGSELVVDSCTFARNRNTSPIKETVDPNYRRANSIENTTVFHGIHEIPKSDPVLSKTWVTNTIFSETEGDKFSIYNTVGAGEFGAKTGEVTDGGYNLASDDGGGVLKNKTTSLNKDARLGAAQNNGGPTFTCALLAGSPARNAGKTKLTSDQRWATRPQHGRADIGAFEALDPSGSQACIVTTPLDIVSDDGLISLREALETVNVTGTKTTVTFDPTKFSSPQTILLSGPELDLRTSIMGPSVGVTISGKARTGSIFSMSMDTSATLTNLSIVGGSASAGGGIYVRTRAALTLSNCTLSDNTASNGGAVACADAGAIQLLNCTFTGNSTTSDGGALFSRGFLGMTLRNCTFSGNNARNGGAIYAANSGVLSVNGCTFAGNNATGAGGGFDNDGYGGVVMSSCTFSGNTATSGAGITSGAGLTLTNSTLVANKAKRGGGAVWVASGSATVNSCTFVDNSSADRRGGGFYTQSADVTLTNSIFSGSDLYALTTTRPGVTLGAFKDGGYNLCSGNGNDYLKAPSTRLNIDPKLDVLKNNGGPTATCALLPGSPAINTGGTSLNVDQRGVARPYQLRKDIGAYEFNLTTPEVTVDPALSINDVNIMEGNSGTQTVSFTVLLSAPSTKEVRVNYATSNATARAGSDYDPKSGSLVFAPGQTQQSIVITVRGDTLVETDEQFYVILSRPDGATIDKIRGTCTIRNDDRAPRSFGNSAASS